MVRGVCHCIQTQHLPDSWVSETNKTGMWKAATPVSHKPPDVVLSGKSSAECAHSAPIPPEKPHIQVNLTTDRYWDGYFRENLENWWKNWVFFKFPQFFYSRLSSMKISGKSCFLWRPDLNVQFLPDWFIHQPCHANSGWPNSNSNMMYF